MKLLRVKWARWSMLAFALVLAFLFPLQQGTAQELSATDRIPTNDPFTAVFPRWLPIDGFFLFSDGSSGPELSGLVQDFAVEPSGVIHVVARGVPGGIRILYANNRWETRGANGFSRPFIVSETGASNDMRIAVAPNGQVAVVWLEEDSIFVRVLDPNAGWKAPRVWGASATYRNPYIHYDAQNKLHLTVFREIHEFDSEGRLIRDDHEILYAVNFEDFTIVAKGSALIPPGDIIYAIDYPDGDSFVSTDSQGRVHVAWTHAVGRGKRVIRHQQSPTALETMETISDPSFSLLPDWGFAVDGDGNAHFSFSDTEGDKLMYRRRLADRTLEAVETVPLPAGSKPFGSGIAVDSRNQPVIMWQDSPSGLDALGYATKVKNPAWQEQEGTQWAVQIPISSPTRERGVHGALTGPRIQVTEKAVHVFAPTSERPYTRTVEYNLGEQDSFVTYPAGPNATANVATGNLLFQLPLFASRGAGFATSLALVYNSLDEEVGPFSPGWTHSYGMTLTRYGAAAHGAEKKLSHTLRLGDGQTIAFNFDSKRDLLLAVDEFGFFAKLEFGVEPAAPDEYLMTTKFGIKYIFRPDGKLKEIRDTNDNSIKFEYGPNDESNRSEITLGISESVLTKIIDTMERETKFRYDEKERIKEVEDPAGTRYKVTYNAEGKLEKVQFAAAPGPEVAWRFEYHKDSKPKEIQGLSDVFNLKGFLHRVYTPRGNNADFFHEFYYLLDGRFRVARQPKEDLTQARYVFSYLDRPPKDERGESNAQEVLVRNRRGFDTKVEYERLRSLGLKVIDALDNSIERTFGDPLTDFRNLLRFKDRRGARTAYTYYRPEHSLPDYVGDNLKEIHRPGVSRPIVYTYTIDDLNRIESVIDSNNNTTIYNYDTAGNLASIVHPILCKEDFQYDSLGRVTTSISANRFATKFFYNDAPTGLVTEILRPDHARAERFQYDMMGNTKKSMLPEGGVTDFVLDGLYRLQKQIAPLGDAGRAATSFEYDEDSNVKVMLDPRDSLTTHVYDKLGRLRKTINAQNEAMEFSYDAEGNTREVSDFKGNITKSLYDELNRVIREERSGPPPIVREFRYDPNGNLQAQIVLGDAQHPVQTTTFEYDARNNLTKTTHSINTLTDENFYDANDNLVVSIRREGGIFKYGTTNVYDERNRLTSTTQLTSDPIQGTGSGLTTQYKYDCNGNRTMVVDALNKTTEFRYDGSDRTTETIDGKGVVASKVKYNDNDLRTEAQIQNPAGAGLITNQIFVYNARNELKEVMSPIDGSVQQSFYDANGNLIKQIDAESNVKEFQYDALNRLMEQKEFLDILTAAVTRFEYDANSNRIKIIDPRSFEYKFDYDEANRLIKLTYPPINGVSNSESWIYDVHGNLASHTDANGKKATFEYDLLDRLIKEIHGAPFDKVIKREYDGASNLKIVEFQDESVRVKFPEYDPLNRLKRMEWVVNSQPFKSIRYEYEEVVDGVLRQSNNRVRMLGPEGEIFKYIYDENNRLKELQRAPSVGAPFITFAALGYDTGGRRNSTTLANGTVMKYDYDAKERLKNIRALRSGNESDIISSFTYDYNRIDNRTSVKLDHFNAQVVDYRYNNLSWLTGESWRGGGIGAQVIPYEGIYNYDPSGNRTLKQTPTGNNTYEYDAENRLTSELVTQEAEPQQVSGSPLVDSTHPGFTPERINDDDTTDNPEFPFAWRSRDQATQHFAGLQFPNPTQIARADLYIPTFGGSLAMSGEIQRFKLQALVNGHWIDIAPTRVIGAESNPAAPGWFRTLTPTSHMITFEFTVRIASGMRFLMDQGGGSKAQPNVFWVNEVDAFTPAIRTTEILYAYDKNGNQIRKTQGTTGEDFGYDYANRLISYKRTEGGQIKEHWTYLYAPTGERLNKKNELAGETEWFMYDGADVIADYKGPSASSAALVASYANSLAIDSKIARIKPTGEPFFYIPDALGSVHQVIDQQQQVTNIQLTTAWGEALPGILSRGSAVSDRYGFTQRERDDESSLMHFRARSYDPKLGRFVQKDPDTSRTPREHYAYTLNNPLIYTDPLGLQEEREGLELEKLWFNARTLQQREKIEARMAEIEGMQLLKPSDLKKVLGGKFKDLDRKIGKFYERPTRFLALASVELYGELAPLGFQLVSFITGQGAITDEPRRRELREVVQTVIEKGGRKFWERNVIEAGKTKTLFGAFFEVIGSQIVETFSIKGKDVQLTFDAKVENGKTSGLPGALTLTLSTIKVGTDVPKKASDIGIGIEFHTERETGKPGTDLRTTGFVTAPGRGSNRGQRELLGFIEFFLTEKQK